MEITLIAPNMVSSFSIPNNDNSSPVQFPDATQSNNENHSIMMMADHDMIREEDGSSGSGESTTLSSDHGSDLTILLELPSSRRKQRNRIPGQLATDTEGNIYWLTTGENGETLQNRATYLTKEIRLDMINEMAKLGQYKFPRHIERTSADDKTSFLPEQATWGRDRPNRPEIVTQYNKEEKDKKSGPLPQAAMLEWRDLIVIDGETKKPVRDFPHIPLCLSSYEEGWSLEAMARLDPRITHADFAARMPFWDRPSIKSISMRRSRFRWRAGCKSWVSRSASDKIDGYLDKFIPKDLRDANDTRDWRDLTDREITEMKEPSKGKYPERSRKAKGQLKKDKAPLRKDKGKSRKRQVQSKKGKGRSEKAQHELSISNEDVDQQTQQLFSPVDEDVDQQTQPLFSPVDEDMDYQYSHSYDESEQFSTLDEDMYYQHTHSCDGSEQNEVLKFDFRDQTPSKPFEKRAIKRALDPTRLQISGLINKPPFPTNEDASYNDQLSALYNYYVIASEGNPILPLEEMHTYSDAWHDEFPKVLFLDNYDPPETW